MPEFSVAFAFRMQADTASDAVDRLIDAFTERGLRNWVYQVVDPATGDFLGNFDGYGDEVDVTGMVEDTTSQGDTAAASTEADAPADKPDPAQDAIAAAIAYNAEQEALAYARENSEIDTTE